MLLDLVKLTGLQKGTQKLRWLFKNVVKGIADYGNCIGVPTVAGEVEFDPSFDDYCLVDVASIGFGRRDQIVRNHASNGDYIILAGGATGREGMGGARLRIKRNERGKQIGRSDSGSLSRKTAYGGHIGSC